MLRAVLLAVTLATGAAAQTAPLPLPLGGPFTLVDQHGRIRTEIYPDGRLQLVYFGYAACDSICTAALPQMARLAARPPARGIGIIPVMVTVDPQNDTPQAMARVLGALDPDFLGLTVIPPVLSNDRAEEIIAGYAPQG